MFLLKTIKQWTNIITKRWRHLSLYVVHFVVYTEVFQMCSIECLWQGWAQDKDSNARPQESVVATVFIDNHRQKSQNNKSNPTLVLTSQKQYTTLNIKNNKQYLLMIHTLCILTTWDNLENTEQRMPEYLYMSMKLCMTKRPALLKGRCRLFKHEVKEHRWKQSGVRQAH